MESTFLVKLFIWLWFNVVTGLEEYLYLHALLIPIEILDLAGLGGVKGCWSDTGYMLSSGREGAAPLIVKMEDRLSGGNLRHYCIQELALCDGDSMVVWVGINKDEKRHWWLRMETSTPPCSWTFGKTSAFHTKEELMEQHSAARRLRLPIYGRWSERISWSI